MSEKLNILDHIAVVKDFPKAGINFYDIQSLLAKPFVWREIIEQLAERASRERADIILGIESRGFVAGMPVAYDLGLPFGMVRKKGKLPGKVISQEYSLEYGTDTVEVQDGLIEPGMRVVIVDDLLATGGTMKAASDLAKKIGGNVVLGECIIELPELGGLQKIDIPFYSLSQAPLDPFKPQTPEPHL